VGQRVSQKIRGQKTRGQTPSEFYIVSVPRHAQGASFAAATIDMRTLADYLQLPVTEIEKLTAARLVDCPAAPCSLSFVNHIKTHNL